jgi:hypothetical protein
MDPVCKYVEPITETISATTVVDKIEVEPLEISLQTFTPEELAEAPAFSIEAFSQPSPASAPSLSIPLAHTPSSTKFLAQKKRNFILNELVKCPYDDHTYAISATSIAAALQSSNIFNQNNSSLASFSCSEQFSKLKAQYKLNENSLTMNSNINAVSTTNATRQQQPTELTIAECWLRRLKEFSNTLVGCVDDRECVLCHLKGDHSICDRLLSFDVSWVHLNCLLWSNGIQLQEHLIEQIQTCLTKARTTVSIFKKSFILFSFLCILLNY